MSHEDFEVVSPEQMAAELAAAQEPTGPRFADLGLAPELLQALSAAGYDQPTEVQARAIPAAMEGRDLRVCSSTGSGKTAAFVLPALMKVLAARKDPANKPRKGVIRGPRILVLVPTRELAMQVARAASNYGRHVPYLAVTSIVGGVPYAAQLRALRMPLDILIATPGRLIDHIGAGKAVLENVEMLVLDEADRMLDMGFIEDIEHIAQALPMKRQTLMASATFDGEVGRLAQTLQREDVARIEVAAHTEQHENITQELLWADNLDHKHALLDHLLTGREVDQAVVFTSTQVDADRLADRLADMGHAVASLHGGMPQGRRNRVLSALRSRQLRILVATDVAARGIDVPTITHVVNYGLPLKAEDYVHRIGRTGRAGRSGRAVTLAERRDVAMIRRIQQYTTQAIPVITVEGLEPQRETPEIFLRKPMNDRRGAGRGPAGRGGDRGFAPQRGHRDGFDPRFGQGPRPAGAHSGPRHGGSNDRFEGRPAAPREHFEPRFGAERGGPAGKPSFGGRPPRPFGQEAGRDGGRGFDRDAERQIFQPRRREEGPDRHEQAFGHRPYAVGPKAAVRDSRAQGRAAEAGPKGGFGKPQGKPGFAKPHQGPAGASNKPRWASKGSKDGMRPRKAV